MHLDLLWAILAGAILGSLADWLFAGVLFHRRYNIHPEIWRATSNETRRVILAQLTALLTAGAFVWLSYRLGQTDLTAALTLAICGTLVFWKWLQRVSAAPPREAPQSERRRPVLRPVHFGVRFSTIRSDRSVR